MTNHIDRSSLEMLIGQMGLFFEAHLKLSTNPKIVSMLTHQNLRFEFIFIFITKSPKIQNRIFLQMNNEIVEKDNQK